jgi:hypothetical protein
MTRYVLFIDRPGIRICDQWILAKGRRVPIAALREVMIVEGSPDPKASVTITVAATTSTVAVVLATQTESALIRFAALLAILVALGTALCTLMLRPPTASLEARYSGRTELLVAGANATLVNQIGRALIRACEWNNVRPAVYRVHGPRTNVTLLILLILVLGLFAAGLTGVSLVNHWGI